MLTPANNRKIAIALAFAGSLPITGPLVWLHKVHTGKYLWGLAYLLLFKTGLPAVACCVEGVWYLLESDESFMARFPQAGALLTKLGIAKLGTATESDVASAAAKIQAARQQTATAEATQQAAIALRDLEQLRQEGLITESEFEQKRRQLILTAAGEQGTEQVTKQQAAVQSDKQNTQQVVKIDANTASVDSWLQLPGLSIHQARTLHALTQKGLSFSCIEDVAVAIALPVSQAKQWEAQLQFCYYDREAALEPTAINANTATALELATVPTIDIFLGRAIVHYRQQGPYRDLADLQDRLRLTTAATTDLLHYLKF